MSPHPSSGASSLPSSPEGVAQGFAAAWNAADADALAALFVEDADFVNVVGLWWNNRERIRAAHDYGFRRIFADSQMHLDKVRVRELGEGLAVVHALWTLTGQSPAPGDGPENPPGDRQGVISFTVQKQQVTHDDDGVWLAVSAQNTDRVPGTETLTAEGEALRPTAYQDLGGTTHG